MIATQWGSHLTGRDLWCLSLGITLGAMIAFGVSMRIVRSQFRKMLINKIRAEEAMRRLQIIEKYKAMGRDTSQLEKWFQDTSLDSKIFAVPPPESLPMRVDL